jgi:hypothetical protein
MGGSIMGSTTRKAYAFLYVRRGLSLSWDLADSQLDAVPREGERIGARLDESSSDPKKREWIRVLIEPEPGEDRGDSIGRAEFLAEAELQRRHPGHRVMP